MTIDRELLVQEYLINNKSMVDLANELGITRSKLYYNLKKFDLLHTDIKKTKTIKRSINNSLVNLENPGIYYLAGLVATDGFIRANNIILTLSNDEGYSILKRIANHFDYSGEIRRRDNHGGFSINPYYELTIHSVEMIHIFEDYFRIIGKKSDGLERFPNKLTSALDTYQKMYIRGIFDGDGTFDISRGRYQITSGNYLFIKSLCKYLNDKFSFDIEVKRREDRDKRYPFLLIPRVQSEVLASWIYSENTDIDDLYIQYKYDKYKEYIKNR